ncbi:thiamine biosynthesis protein ThiJ [Bremerella cremea]|uniref:Thiamine biosynthesis protein ThiJ n=1 Tax=Bremerella cremea TaxID=1031537 RepID=A0A368KLE6_9BACT|nr:DJ-1/PfpI family protein [Bremerella cremea]RCS42046.1 thiamine biosynthesis protein ThiJ [Bremerella cremea]
MLDKPLAGKKIAVVVESKYIPEEIKAYKYCFGLLGAKVDLISRLYYGSYAPGDEGWTSAVFYSDVDPNEQKPWETPEMLAMEDNKDVSRINLDDYAALIMSANYTSVRLRYTDDTEISDARSFVQSAPVVRFFAEAMGRKDLVKGLLCHGLWILTPNRDLLKSRRVTCHTVVMADILNTDAHIVFEKDENGKSAPAKVVTDGDLVTGFSKDEVVPFIEAIALQISMMQTRVH